MHSSQNLRLLLGSLLTVLTYFDSFILFVETFKGESFAVAVIGGSGFGFGLGWYDT
jgi:hypothetical protein